MYRKIWETNDKEDRDKNIKMGVSGLHAVYCRRRNVLFLFCYLFTFSTDPVGGFKSFLILNSDTVPRYEITNRLV